MSEDGIVYALFLYEKLNDKKILLSIHPSETDAFDTILLLAKTKYIGLFASFYKNIKKNKKEGREKKFKKHFLKTKEAYNALCEQTTNTGIEYNFKSLHKSFINYYNGDEYFEEIFETMDKVIEDYLELFTYEEDRFSKRVPILFSVEEFVIGQNKLINQECESEIDNIIIGAESML